MMELFHCFFHRDYFYLLISFSFDQWSYRFHKPNFIVLKIIYRIIILQKLGTQHPIIITYSATQAMKLPWVYQQSIWFAFFAVLQICLSWHLDDCRSLPRCCSYSKIEWGQLIIHKVVAMAMPDRLLFWAFEANAWNHFHELNKRWFWS